MEIENAANKMGEAFNNGTLNPADHYTEDCQVIRPGYQAACGHQGS